MQKQINLEEILKSYLTVEAMRVNNPDYTFNMVLSAMKDACKQTLMLASENGKTKEVEYDYGGVRAGCKYYKSEFDKQSILDTIKQIN